MMIDKTQMDPLISSLDSNEYFNSLSHLLTALLSIAGLTILITFAAQDGKWLHLICFTIYGLTLFLCMAASTLLHFYLLFNRYKRSLGILDHNAIYLFIAGTFTPLCLIVVSGTLGWWVFSLVWSYAIILIIFRTIYFTKIPKHIAMLSYFAMSGLSLLILYDVYVNLSFMAIVLMLIGGFFYGVGSIVFFVEKPNPFPPFFGNHEIWHFSVVMGNSSYFLLMLLFVLPYS